MIGELIFALILVFGLNEGFKERSRREYQEAKRQQEIEIADRLNAVYYDSLRQHYDSLDIK